MDDHPALHTHQSVKRMISSSFKRAVRTPISAGSRASLKDGVRSIHRLFFTHSAPMHFELSTIVCILHIPVELTYILYDCFDQPHYATNPHNDDA
jgi:hypothetical protein